MDAITITLDERQCAIYNSIAFFSVCKLLIKYGAHLPQREVDRSLLSLRSFIITHLSLCVEGGILFIAKLKSFLPFRETHSVKEKTEVSRARVIRHTCIWLLRIYAVLLNSSELYALRYTVPTAAPLFGLK